MKSVNQAIVADPKSTCDVDLEKGPWNFDSFPGYGPGASEFDPIPNPVVRPGQLPVEYQKMDEDELHRRIVSAKETLGDKLVILGHFYQRDEIVQHADFLGDSFQLANEALTRPEAETIVFCGVHFMAETADILAKPHQRVILPNLAAGCSMADMADEESVERRWAELTELLPGEKIIPVTYMNSSAALKAFCGRNGGIVCTSSNAAAVMEWAFAQGNKVLFFPDQHLGRNTGKAMGISLDEMVMLPMRGELNAETKSALAGAKVILWPGFCSVHKRFTVDQVAKARADYPNVRVIVHPECPMEVVDVADESGSTDYIRRAVQNAEPGSVLAIGTEINLVNRLANEHPDKTIFCLDPVICPCSTMYRIHPGYLAWVLDELVGGNVVNEIKVDKAVADDARVALERMLAALPRR